MHKVRFVEDTHQYFLEDKELISVSAFTEKFKPHTDWGKVAARVAKKLTGEGIPTSKDDILKKWERKRDISANIGTMYHSDREQQLLSQNQPVFYNIPCNMKECFTSSEGKFSLPIGELENNTVYPELMIYDFDYMICGQSDKVIIADNTIHIWDYKTDAELKYQAFSSKWTKPEKLLSPLSHLDHCNINIYSIKMSLYMYMIWKANKGRYKIGDLVIEHIQLKRDPDDDNLPILVDGKPVVEKIEKVILPYRKKEVTDMLKTLKIKQ